VCFCLSAGIAVADTTAATRATGAAPARGKMSDEGKIPQVVIIGKRLNAEEKARMAQEENDPKENKMMSRKSPSKTATPPRRAG
jgi:hypothetical protein